jgi:bifunctional non-homologous end joining protein LigD
MPERIVTQVGDRKLALSHLDKQLWPGFTKAQILDYYLRIAPHLLPHTRGRAASFLRTPAGPDGPMFFTHSAPEGLPDWITTAPKADRTHVAVDNVETLIAAVNHYCLEIHVPQWTTTTGPDFHDRLVFDLDPGEGADITTCCRVALLLREQLRDDHLVGYPATSGGKGLHVYVGLNPPLTAEDAVAYTKAIAQRLTAEHRGLITHVRGPKARAGGKVLLDWAQNHTRATTATPYTLRVHRGATLPAVSAPLDWDEVTDPDPQTLDPTPADLLKRVDEHGDLARDLTDPAPF